MLHPTIKRDNYGRIYMWTMWDGSYGFKVVLNVEKELVHDHITKDDGTQVGVTKCPDGCGMIKSPMCCGHDMVCEVN